jgi:hypothetical protein
VRKLGFEVHHPGDDRIHAGDDRNHPGDDLHPAAA